MALRFNTFIRICLAWSLDGGGVVALSSQHYANLSMRGQCASNGAEQTMSVHVDSRSVRRLLADANI